MVAVAHGPGLERRRVRARARLREAVAGDQLHGGEARDEAAPLLIRAVAVDHPCGHVVDRQIGRNRRAAGGERLEDQRGVEPRHARSAHVVAGVDSRHAERRRLAHHVHGKVLLLVPFDRMGGEVIRREGKGHVADGDLIVGEGKLGHGLNRHTGGVLGNHDFRSRADIQETKLVCSGSRTMLRRKLLNLILHGKIKKKPPIPAARCRLCFVDGLNLLPQALTEAKNAIYIFRKRTLLVEQCVRSIGNIDLLPVFIQNFILLFEDAGTSAVTPAFMDDPHIRLLVTLYPFGDFEGQNEDRVLVIRTYKLDTDGMAFEDGLRLSDFLGSKLNHVLHHLVCGHFKAPEPGVGALKCLNRPCENRRSQGESGGESLVRSGLQTILTSSLESRIPRLP
jgi:hypothetical protein